MTAPALTTLAFSITPHGGRQGIGPAGQRQADGVGAFAGVLLHHVGEDVDLVGVVAGAAHQGVDAGAACQPVISTVALQAVGAGIAHQRVTKVLRAAHVLDVQQRVAAAMAILRGRARGQVDHGAAGPGVEVVGDIGAALAVEGVIAGVAVQHLQRGGVAAGQGVVVQAATHLLDVAQGVGATQAVAGRATQRDAGACVGVGVGHPVLAARTVDGVVARAALEALDEVAARAADQRIGQAAATHMLDAREGVGIAQLIGDDDRARVGAQRQAHALRGTAVVEADPVFAATAVHTVGAGPGPELLGNAAAAAQQGVVVAGALHLGDVQQRVAAVVAGGGARGQVHLHGAAGIGVDHAVAIAQGQGIGGTDGAAVNGVVALSTFEEFEDRGIAAANAVVAEAAHHPVDVAQHVGATHAVLRRALADAAVAGDTTEVDHDACRDVVVEVGDIEVGVVGAVGDGVAIERVVACIAQQELRPQAGGAHHAVVVGRPVDRLDRDQAVIAVGARHGAGKQVDGYGAERFRVSDPVGPGAAIQRVIAAVADQRVVATSAYDPVGAASALEMVTRSVGPADVLEPRQRVVAMAAAGEVGGQVHGHAAGGAEVVHPVGAAGAVQAVVARAATQHLVAAAAGEGVVGIAAHRALHVREAVGAHAGGGAGAGRGEGQRDGGALVVVGDDVFAASAVHRVVAQAGPEPVQRGVVAGDGIVAAAADHAFQVDQRVGAVAGGHAGGQVGHDGRGGAAVVGKVDVGLRAAHQRVIAGAAGQ